MEEKNIFRDFLKSLFYYFPLSDKQYIKIKYFYTFRRILDLKNPQSFNEKIHWLNLNNYFDQYTTLADKFAVRDYVSKRIGSQYLNESCGVYDSEIEIDFEKLPAQFILKATHGSHWNIFCKNKNDFDEKEARKKLHRWMSLNYYRFYRERSYRNITPRIVCERFINDKRHYVPNDYKLFCFHGKVQFITVDIDRFIDPSAYFFDKDWHHFPCVNEVLPMEIKEKPKNLHEMIAISETLAEGIPFVRVDLYNVNQKIIFGEMTFTPDAGFGKPRPDGWDDLHGTYLHLPEEVH